MIYDCTHSLHPDLPGYPGDTETLRIESRVTGSKMNSSIHLSAHFGTHMDTPQHFFADREGISRWDAQQMRTSALWLTCKQGKHGFFLPQDIAPDSLPNTGWIFLHTSWGERWGTESYYTGFPGLDQTVIQTLLSRDVEGVGLDAPSVDPVPDEPYRNHYAWLGDNRYILENLRRPDQVKDGTVYRTTIAPIPFNPAEAAPCRVFHEAP